MKYLSILSLMILALSSMEAKSNPKKYVLEGQLELFDHGMYWTKRSTTYKVQALYFDEPRGCYYTYRTKLKKLRLKNINVMGRNKKPGALDRANAIGFVNIHPPVKLFELNEMR